MFDIGWTEMLVVAVVAIIVVGPKDLPGMLRNVGRTVKKVRGMASDFQQQFNDAIEETGLDDVKSSIDDVRNLNPTKQIKDKLNPLKDSPADKPAGDESEKKSNDYDPNELFDESKAPADPEPVKVDVEEALERQKKIDAEAAKISKAKKQKASKRKLPAKKKAAPKTTSKAKA